MTDWAFATGDALTRKAWSKSWWIEAKTESYFYSRGFVGSNYEEAIIVELSDLQKEQGDKISYGQTRELGSEGVTGDNGMEDNEEEPDVFDDDVTLDQIRNAVRLKGKLSGQRPSDKSLRQQSKMLLKRWMAGIIDQKIFTALGTSPTKVLYGGDATSTATIEAGDYMTLALIGKAATYAKKATPSIMGPSMGGKRMNGIVVMAPDQSFDLTTFDGAWQQTRMDALIRGKDNPVFTDALGMHKDVPIQEHVRVGLATTWGSGSNLAGASALYMGVGAGVIAYAKERIWNEKTFDYGNKVGFCIGSILGASKSIFNSADNALIALRTYRSNN